MTAEPVQIAARLPVWTFGDRVRKVRRDARLTQRQFAAELGVTATSVDAWESDRNKPRDLVAMSQRVEMRFGLPRGWMLGYADGPHLGGHQVNVAGAGFEPATSGLRAWRRLEAASPASRVRGVIEDHQPDALIIPLPRRSQTVAAA